MPKAAARGMPERIGKYMVIKEVGRGSTGVVYLSHDAYYGRDVAIKVYNMDAGADAERAHEPPARIDIGQHIPAGRVGHRPAERPLDQHERAGDAAVGGRVDHTSRDRGSRLRTCRRCAADAQRYA